MRRGVMAVLAVLALGVAPGNAAGSMDVASTHVYLVAGYAALHATVTKWSAIDAATRRLDGKLAGECPKVGEGAPQNEEAQRMSYEVAGALWASAYHTDASIVRRFARAVKPLRWSDPRITRSAQRFVRGLQEMVALHVPDLCGDVRAWKASGFATIPQSTLSYDKHVEAIEVKEVPPRLLRPFVAPADRGLQARDERLNKRFQDLETVKGFDYWDTLLETLALPQ